METEIDERDLTSPHNQPTAFPLSREKNKSPFLPSRTADRPTATVISERRRAGAYLSDKI